LNLSDNLLGINKNNFIKISKALKMNFSIRELDLSRNYLNENEFNMEFLCEALQINTCIKHLTV